MEKASLMKLKSHLDGKNADVEIHRTPSNWPEPVMCPRLGWSREWRPWE